MALSYSFDFAVSRRFTAPRRGVAFPSRTGVSGSRAQRPIRGHEIQVADAHSQKMGRGNAVMVDSHGIKYGASDPRADGQAIPENPNDWGVFQDFLEVNDAFEYAGDADALRMRRKPRRASRTSFQTNLIMFA